MRPSLFPCIRFSPMECWRLQVIAFPRNLREDDDMLSGPIINEQSPLKRIPGSLNDRQRLFVDGIRYSIEMADVAFTRLCTVAVSVDNEGSLPDGVEFAHVFLDSWSIVDAVHRLRRLVDGFPRAKNTPR